MSALNCLSAFSANYIQLPTGNKKIVPAHNDSLQIQIHEITMRKVATLQQEISRSIPRDPLPPPIKVEQRSIRDFPFSKENLTKTCRILSGQILKAKEKNDLDFLDYFTSKFNESFANVYPNCSLDQFFPKYSHGTIHCLASELLLYIERDEQSVKIKQFLSEIADGMPKNLLFNNYEKIRRECVELTEIPNKDPDRGRKFSRFLYFFKQIYPVLEIHEALKKTEIGLLFTNRKILCQFIIEQYPPREVIFRIERINFFETMKSVRVQCEDVFIEFVKAVVSKYLPLEAELAKFYQLVGEYLPFFPIQEKVVELSQKEQCLLCGLIMEWIKAFNRTICHQKLEAYFPKESPARTAHILAARGI